MTNKQIIIDRVDVSEWTDEEIYYKFEKYSSKAIRQIAFDLYKQLKHKEQECERLKKQLERKEENYQKLLSKSNKYIHNLVDENVQDISNLAKQLDQLKAKNNELKAQNIKYMNGNISYQLKNSLYRQTLIEIKEFLQSDYCTEIASCEFCAEAGNCLNRKILQKIRECEVGNEYS